MIHKVRKHRELHTISVNTKTTDAFPPVSFTPIITYAQSPGMECKLHGLHLWGKHVQAPEGQCEGF